MLSERQPTDEKSAHRVTLAWNPESLQQLFKWVNRIVVMIFDREDVRLFKMAD
jgi:hypothetical protein